MHILEVTQHRLDATFKSISTWNKEMMELFKVLSRCSNKSRAKYNP